MDWSKYKVWQAGDPVTRPEIDLVDGYLAGAAIALHEKSAAEWVAEIIAPQTAEPDEGRRLAAEVVAARFKEITAALKDAGSYIPILSEDGDGGFDLSGWATGFMEAIGADADLWSYILADKAQGGLMGLIAVHAVGETGTIARQYVADNTNGVRLNKVAAEAWSFIPGLLEFLYRIKLQQIPDSA